MRYIRKLWSFRINIHPAAGALLILLAAVGLTAAQFVLQAGSITMVKDCIIASNFMIFLLNFLPIICIMLLLYFLANNVVVACGVTGFAVLLLAILNRNMIQMRGAPFKPMDLLLGGEFMGIAKSIDKRLFVLLGAGVVLYILCFALCMHWIQVKKMRPMFRAAGSVAMLAAILAVNSLVYADKKLYESMYMQGNFYNEVDNFESKGFLYSFLYSLNTSKITKPDHYDKKEIERYIGDFQGLDLSTMAKPNIILILSEAFSEMPMSPHLRFDGYIDPMQHYKQIKERSVGGYIVVPNYGGGTADTEFDIFTGLSARHFRGTPYAYNLVTKPFMALPRVLTQLGYDNIAIHPGFTWFYNRQNVYPFLGFNEFIGIEGFDEKDTKGMYVTEEATFDRLIQEYESHADASGDPFFAFCLTIQNHGPYKGKYLAEPNFSSGIPFTPDEADALSNYFEGMADCDRELNRLVEYMDSRAEPVVLIYYGDHLPSFPEEIYNRLLPGGGGDGLEDQVRKYKTPFIIYQNPAARDSTAIESNLGKLPPGNIMSANYLGAAVLELLGYSGTDAFIDYVNDLRKDYPILWENQYFEPSGEIKTLDPLVTHPINLYQRWEYYKIFDE